MHERRHSSLSSESPLSRKLKKPVPLEQVPHNILHRVETISLEDQDVFFVVYESMNSWEEVFQAEQVRDWLMQYENHADDLKLMRKVGTIICSFYYLFSKTHKPPSQFTEFIHVVGLAKDAAEPNLRSELIQQLITIIDQNASELSSDYLIAAFDFDTRAGMWQQLLFLHTRAVQLSQKIDTEYQMPVTDFHDLRKIIRSFMNYVRLIAYKEKREKKSGVTKEIFLRLFKTVYDMGEMHDEIISSQLTQEQYQHLHIRLSTNIQSEIQEVLLIIEKAFDIKKYIGHSD